MFSFTKNEMLALWRRCLGFDTIRTDCTVSSYEGIYVDDIITRHMRQWYLHLLDTAPAHLVPTADFAESASLTIGSDGWGRIELPEGARRPISIKLSGWNVAAQVISDEKAEPILARMASPFAMPGPCSPLAFYRHGLRINPAIGNIEGLIAVADPGPERFDLDESLIATISHNLPSIPLFN